MNPVRLLITSVIQACALLPAPARQWNWWSLTGLFPGESSHQNLSGFWTYKQHPKYCLPDPVHPRTHAFLNAAGTKLTECRCIVYPAQETSSPPVVTLASV